MKVDLVPSGLSRYSVSRVPASSQHPFPFLVWSSDLKASSTIWPPFFPTFFGSFVSLTADCLSRLEVSSVTRPQSCSSGNCWRAATQRQREHLGVGVKEARSSVESGSRRGKRGNVSTWDINHHLRIHSHGVIWDSTRRKVTDMILMPTDSSLCKLVWVLSISVPWMKHWTLD